MKFRRKPVERTLVDALKGASHYTVQWPDGLISNVPLEDFEHDYAPAHASPEKKPRKPRKNLGVLAPPSVGKPQ